MDTQPSANTDVLNYSSGCAGPPWSLAACGIFSLTGLEASALVAGPAAQGLQLPGAWGLPLAPWRSFLPQTQQGAPCGAQLPAPLSPLLPAPLGALPFTSWCWPW